MSAGHRERARKIKNHTALGRGTRADLNPRVEKVRPFVSWFNSFLTEKSFYPGRPRGGLTNRPVSPPPAGADHRAQQWLL